MLNIFCPHCGESRSEEEFHAAGQAHIPRPLDPNSCTDQEWGDYLFFRDNPRGPHHELWIHAAGCRQYFNATRHTVSYQIHETYKIGERPSVTAKAPAPAKSEHEPKPLVVDHQVAGAKA